LIDQYVAEEFEGEELERAENYFLKSPERQQKLQFARALSERKSRKSPRTRSHPWSSTRYLAIAASIIAVIGIGFVIWRAFYYQRDLEKGLLALQTAYREQRPIEARLSDFKYAPQPNERGGAEKVDSIQRDLAGTLLLQEVSRNPTAKAHHAAGQYYLARREFSSAIEQLTAALTLDPNNAKIHSDLGAALLELGRIESTGSEKGKELETFGRSLEHLQKALELDPSLLEAYFNRALLFQYMMPSKQAETAWKEYLQKDSRSPWAEEAKRNLKLIEDRRATSWHEGNEVKDFLSAELVRNDDTAWRVIGENYSSAGNEVTNHLLDSLFGVESMNQESDKDSIFRALSYVAKLEANRAGDQYTSDLVRQYQRAPQQLRPKLESARAHMRDGYRLFTESKFSEALTEYTKAKSYYKEAQDQISDVFVEYRLAHCYVFLPDVSRAQLAFKRLLNICEANHYRWLVAQCLFGLAHVSADRSEYSKAIDYSERALAEFEKVGDLNGILNSLTQLADFHEAVNRVSKALTYLGRAMTLANSEQAKPMQRWGILNQIGFSMTSLQLYAAALFYQKEALGIAVDMSRPLLLSRSYAYVGSALAAMRRYTEAVNEATAAFEIGRSISTSTGGLEIMANASQQLGDIYRKAGRCDKAIENYDSSIKLYGHLNFAYYSYMAHKGKLNCFMATSDNDAIAAELRTVLDLFESYRSKITVESQRNSYFDAEQSVYDTAISYEFVRRHDRLTAFDYSERSRARSLLDAVQFGASLRKDGGETGLDFSKVSHPLSIVELREKMPGNTQIIQYAALEDRLLIWIVDKSAVQSVEVPVGSKALTDIVKVYLEGIKERSSDQSNRAKELYRILLQPIEPYLNKSKTLCVVADKILHYLPLGALISPVTSRYVIQDYELTSAPSSSVFVNLSFAAERKAGAFDEKLLSVGNPHFNRVSFDWLRELPSSAREATEVAVLYPKHHVLIGDEATETAIKTEIETSDVAHFAMHYALNEQTEMLSGFPLTPERTSMPSDEMSNGFFQSYEIYHLNLRRPRLVVLSACSTGIEKQYQGEGAIGAARPFLIAGVPIVVASLWAVDSDASAELMVSFHKYRREGLTVTKALRKAQIDMIEGQGSHYRLPYYWAPFLSIGGLSAY
jgi:CHAT domain-containing protein/tetratricopeptide (TPR) repeat protein